MKNRTILFISALIICSGLLRSAVIMAQATEEPPSHTFANTPPEIYPFFNFMEPNLRWFEERHPYLGAAREYPFPENPDVVKIGFIAPLDGSSAYYSLNGQQMLNGTLLAFEQANREGGYNGIPFEVIARNDIGLWGASGSELVTLDDMGVLAAIGSIDGNNSHVAIRVALKLELPMVNTGSTDPTLTDTRIPWVIRTNQDDRQFNFALLNEVYNMRGYNRVALLRANNRYARVGTREFVDGARRLGKPLVIRQVYLPGETDFAPYLEKIAEADAEAVLLWGEVNEIAEIIRQMREAGMSQTVFTSDKAVSDYFLQLAGGYAEGVVAAFPYHPHSGNPELERFYENYRERFGAEPGSFAVQAYDGAQILIDAIRRAGLNRALVRDEITSLETYYGITGEIRLDGSWNNSTPAFIAEIRNGEFYFRQYEWHSASQAETATP